MTQPATPSLPARVAYFSMEVSLESDLPTYSGGLGVLAGDTLRGAADLHVPMVGVTLVHRKGYVTQELGPDGAQSESSSTWSPESKLEEVQARVRVQIEGRDVVVRAYRYDVIGASSGRVAVYLLDTDLPENAAEDRCLTDHLYGGDARYRLCQEVVLGIGGVRLLRELGFRAIERFHMNEGHAALLALELLDEAARARGSSSFNHDDVAAVRKQCVFTTHTPVPAGHDQFPLELARQVLGRPEIYEMHEVFCCAGVVNMTYVALNLSHYVNGVAKRHGEVSQHLFAGYHIEAITNGVHAASWVSGPLQALFDRRLPGWRADNLLLRSALQIPQQEIGDAHAQAKLELAEEVRRRIGVALDPDTLTLGFARRATPYKRTTLVLRDPERLAEVAETHGGMQLLFAGKAHPRDEGGKQLIRDVFSAAARLKDRVTIVYLPNFDTALARRLVSGCDVWLNTPRPPLEASGTSGMKAALNGVPSLSILDGWWLEGHVEGLTGWAFGASEQTLPDAEADDRDAEDLYHKLQSTVLPTYYERPDEFAAMMRHAIAVTGSFFNTHRMVQQYVTHAYFD
jgi:glycogen phosphorylase